MRENHRGRHGGGREADRKPLAALSVAGQVPGWSCSVSCWPRCQPVEASLTSCLLAGATATSKPGRAEVLCSTDFATEDGATRKAKEGTAGGRM